MSMELATEDKRSKLSRIINSLSNLSRAISPKVAGFIIRHVANGYEVLYYITKVLYIVGLFISTELIKIMNKTIKVKLQTIFVKLQ
jgi:hypothetical protein